MPPRRVTVVAPGVATSLRDGGRLGLAHLGRGRGGAADLASLRLANRLVGNDGDRHAVETSGGLVLRVDDSVVVAVTGSGADLAVDGGPPLGWGVPTALPAGAVVRVGRLRGGARCYLAVRGGLHEASPGLLTVGADPGTEVSTSSAVPADLESPIRLWPGPRWSWFTEDSLQTLASAEWTVRPESDRVGLRLKGPRLERRASAELQPEGLVEGAVQVPPDGQPIVMLADHPTTGGYPVIAVVDPDDIGRCAQRAPGNALRFAWRYVPRRDG